MGERYQARQNEDKKENNTRPFRDRRHDLMQDVPQLGCACFGSGSHSGVTRTVIFEPQLAIAVSQSPSFRNGTALVQSTVAKLVVLIALTVLARFFPAPPPPPRMAEGGRYDRSNSPRSSVPSVCANFSATRWRRSASGASRCTQRTTFASSSAALTTSMSLFAALHELDIDIVLEDRDEGGGRVSDVVPKGGGR